RVRVGPSGGCPVPPLRRLRPGHSHQHPGRRHDPSAESERRRGGPGPLELGAVEREAVMKSASGRPGLVFLACCLATGWGCGKPAPKLVPVSGVVVNGDKPVARAAISFAADISQGGQTRDAYGSTDEQGRFSLRTVTDGKGAPVGRYKVVITSDGPSGRLIPRGLTDLNTTTLVVEVKEGGSQDLKLDLSKYK